MKLFRRICYCMGAIIICMLFSNKMTIYASGLKEYVSNNVPASVVRVAESSYQRMVDAVIHRNQEFCVDYENLYNVHLGTPFVIIGDGEIQDEIYYFPIISHKNKVVLVLGVVGTTQGYGISLSTEYVNLLNELDFPNEFYMLYKLGDNICAKNYYDSKMLIANVDGYKTIPASVDFRGTLTLESISDMMDNMSKTNICMAKNIVAKPAKYAPSFSVESSSAKVALLHNKQGQGNYGLCWAASVATVANYVYGTAHTAINVADAMGIEYNAGGTPVQMQTALDYYAITYSYIVNSQLTYAVVQTNIQNQRPPIIYAVCNAGTNEEAAHAVTLYGYGGGYIYLWNSGMNSGAGGSQLIQYNSTATTFPYGNNTFTWTKTISAAR